MVLAGLVLQGCSPCLGVIECSESPHAAVNGRLLVAETGEPVPGARITLYVITGAQTDSAAELTANSGIFELRVGPTPARVGRMALRVTPIGLPGYTIDSLPCETVTIRGDACVLNPIVPKPWVPIHALFSYRGSRGLPVANAQVTFRRTGGPEWFGPSAAESLTSETDGQGMANLFPPGLYATSLDPVVGDLIVELPPAFGTSTRRGFKIYPIVNLAERPIYLVEVGPSVRYALVFTDSSTEKPLAGVGVEFQRTSGIQSVPQSFQANSDTAGAVRIDLRPLATGTLTGDLTIRPPGLGAAPTTIAGFSMPTMDADTLPVAAHWRVGRTGILYPVPLPPESASAAGLEMRSQAHAYRRVANVERRLPPIVGIDRLK